MPTYLITLEQQVTHVSRVAYEAISEEEARAMALDVTDIDLDGWTEERLGPVTIRSCEIETEEP